MAADQDPRTSYEQSLGEEQAHLQRLRRFHRAVVWARIAVLVLFVVLAGQTCSRHDRKWSGAIVVGLAFAGLTVAIVLLERRIAKREERMRYVQAGLTRLDGHIPEGTPDGKRFADGSHPYAVDLDLFGPSSLFRLLCQARTGTGQATLARWLTQAASAPEVLARQRAVAELRTCLSFRRDLWLAGGILRERIREDSLEAWLSAPASPVSVAHRLAAALVGTFGILALYAFVDPRLIAIAATIVLGQRALAYRYRNLRQRVEAAAFQRAYELAAVARVAELLRHQRFADPHLASLVASIGSEGKPASRHIFRLERLVAWLESRRNQMFAPIAWALLLPEQLSFAIEAWRKRHGAAAARWLAAIGEVEALSSLATFSFEHPEYALPQVLSHVESPRLSAIALGHPLIPASTRVCNDIALHETRRLLVVTGSNMSGKSTLLRTVGVNVALAQAGAPVCATTMALTPLQVGASMRAEDSLERGVSRFFAEIKRLHDIISLTASPPTVLFLLDEILNGTNSIDRRDGAAAVVGRLLEHGAIGLITTHDLALANLADTPATRGANIHFQDTLEGDRLVFDYRIQPGVVTRRNALDLMRLVGIDVPSKPA
jgi:hypothetical protein